MILQEKIKILQYFPLFRQLPQKELQVFAQSLTEKIFPPKSYILSQTEAAKNLFILYKGLFDIYIVDNNGKTIPVRIKESPYIAGEMNLFDNVSTANIQALKETSTLVCKKDIFYKLLEKYPKFSLELLKMVNEKLRAANIYTEYYFSQNLRMRTLDVLRTLATHFDNNEISLTHEELSQIIGATRARVTETLHQLVKEKYISLSHKKIRLL